MFELIIGSRTQAIRGCFVGSDDIHLRLPRLLICTFSFSVNDIMIHLGSSPRRIRKKQQHNGMKPATCFIMHPSRRTPQRCCLRPRWTKSTSWRRFFGISWKWLWPWRSPHQTRNLGVILRKPNFVLSSHCLRCVYVRAYKPIHLWFMMGGRLWDRFYCFSLRLLKLVTFQFWFLSPCCIRPFLSHWTDFLPVPNWWVRSASKPHKTSWFIGLKTVRPIQNIFDP